MKILGVPDSIQAFFLDIDGTLYTNQDYGSYQTEALIKQYANYSNIDTEEATKLVEKTKNELFKVTGHKTSLGNVMSFLGVDIATSVKWRQSLFRPKDFLAPNPVLRIALIELIYLNTENTSIDNYSKGIPFVHGSTPEKIKLAAVTNNPQSVGEATLDALGIKDLFSVICGLDNTMKSKPDTAPFSYTAELLKIKLQHCVSVGDRYDIDLAPALELGMGAILVNGVEDVIALKGALKSKQNA